MFLSSEMDDSAKVAVVAIAAVASMVLSLTVGFLIAHLHDGPDEVCTSRMHACNPCNGTAGTVFFTCTGPTNDTQCSCVTR